MSAPAYLPLFPADYLADTTSLSTEEHGAFLLLMMTAWLQPDCSLPDDDRKLARICRLSTRQWKVMRETMLDFWKVENGRWVNARLTKERAYADKKSAANRENARKRWDAQPIENNDGGPCERISDGNAPQPQPQYTTSPDGDVARPDPVETPPIDFAKVAIDSAIAILVAAGRSEAQARRLIGKWRQTFTDGQLIDAVARARERSVADPAAFLAQQLHHDTPRRQNHGKPARNHHDDDEPRNPFVRAALERQAERAAEQRG